MWKNNTYRQPLSLGTGENQASEIRDSSADDSEWATKRRILLTFYAVRFSDPTRALSPRQLPTDHDHAVSTREYQSDQSSRQLHTVIGTAVPNQRLKAHHQERVPGGPPVEGMFPTRTVLAGKGTLRRFAPLPAARRSGCETIATGGSTQEHFVSGDWEKERPASLLRRKTGLIQKSPVSSP